MADATNYESGQDAPSEDDQKVLSALPTLGIGVQTWKVVWEKSGMEKPSDLIWIGQQDLVRMDLKCVPRNQLWHRLKDLHKLLSVHNATMLPGQKRSANEAYPPFICASYMDHRPKRQCRQGDIKYWCFRAAEHGCVDCVRHCIEEYKVAHDAQSDNQRYTVKDFAAHGVKEGTAGAQEVLDYLTELQG